MDGRIERFDEVWLAIDDILMIVVCAVDGILKGEIGAGEAKDSEGVLIFLDAFGDGGFCVAPAGLNFVCDGRELRLGWIGAREDGPDLNGGRGLAELMEKAADGEDGIV